ncbi:site-specific integrase [Pseudonocardia sp. WMMC193]|uniref:site-specific integrase n=1 Tax=Pseudonocardia sp. WMMC193 TaxID=2911965 RepID=UPI001F02217C|nr:site-specific integrase [Pseudonocardia sp. WMMC193]MCF7548890.1 site-specific integrase [Pseudonocardia sp. WMMC193]
MQTPETASGEIVFPTPEGQVPAVRGSQIRTQLATMWLLAQRSVNTEAAYRRDITTYFDWADQFGVEVLAALQVHVDAYRRWLESPDHVGRYRSRQSYSPSTIARKLVVVSSFYRYAIRNSNGLVPANRECQMNGVTGCDG